MTSSDLLSFPVLSRFYGLGFLDLIAMPRAVREEYLRAMPELVAMETLTAMAVADYPHMDQTDRERAHSRIMRRVPGAEPESLDPTSEEGARTLAGAGIGLRVEG